MFFLHTEVRKAYRVKLPASFMAVGTSSLSLAKEDPFLRLTLCYSSGGALFIEGLEVGEAAESL